MRKINPFPAVVLYTGPGYRARRATAFRPTVTLRRPRHFEPPPTQVHAYLSRSTRPSSRTRLGEPAGFRDELPAERTAAWLCTRLAAGLVQRPRVRTRIGSLRSGHAGDPSEWCCRVGGSKSLCFLIHPHHTGIGRRPPAARLCAACPSETTTPRGPAACLRACVVDVSRTCE